MADFSGRGCIVVPMLHLRARGFAPLTLERVKLLKYQDLCEHPVARARALLDFAGLGWEPQTEPFLRRSISDGGPDRYYAVFRNTAAALYRWRQDLSADDQRRINDVVQATSLASLCPSLEP
jgi:hypothetical protein